MSALTTNLGRLRNVLAQNLPHRIVLRVQASGGTMDPGTGLSPHSPAQTVLDAPCFVANNVQEASVARTGLQLRGDATVRLASGWSLVVDLNRVEVEVTHDGITQAGRVTELAVMTAATYLGITYGEPLST